MIKTKEQFEALREEANGPAHDMDLSWRNAIRTIQLIPPLARSLLEIKELLEEDSGYHVAPDNPPEGLGELMRIGAIFERADKVLAAVPDWLKQDD